MFFKVSGLKVPFCRICNSTVKNISIYNAGIMIKYCKTIILIFCSWDCFVPANDVFF
jgi:hypothetical protein